MTETPVQFCVICGTRGGRNGFRLTRQGKPRVYCRGCENDRRKSKRVDRSARRAARPTPPPAPVAAPPTVHTTPATEAETYVVLSDVHCPFEDRRAIDIVCEVIADLRPHGLVLNGDIADLPEVSRHSAGSVAMLEGKRISETFAATKKFVERVTAAAGERCTKKHFIFGNHEDRLRRWLNSGDNAVFAGDEGFDLRIRFGLAANGYIVHDDYPESHIRLGKLLVTHGKYEGKHCAHKHLDEYQTSILVGHTHTVQIYHGSTWDGQRVAVCQGMLGDTETEAFSYKKPPRRWVTGFSVVHVAPDGRFWINLLNIFGGELHYGGKKYPR